MPPEKPQAYLIPFNEPHRAKKLADGSLKCLHRTGKWMTARPGTWIRKPSGDYNIAQHEHMRLVTTLGEGPREE